MKELSEVSNILLARIHAKEKGTTEVITKIEEHYCEVRIYETSYDACKKKVIPPCYKSFHIKKSRPTGVHNTK